jgi:diaminohydroxyphosphoribosylaminopyrimidine deaminase/5-amino-6-(5-phosphoribosylamino)uracil reductase
MATAPDSDALTEAEAWSLLRGLGEFARAGRSVKSPCGLTVDSVGVIQLVSLGEGLVDLFPDATPCYHAARPLHRDVELLFDLYLPLCIGAASDNLVVGHVGQSLDGQIATSTGASCYVTGHQDLVHMHRLRALFDAVLVGRATIACDNPHLTTRLVPGTNPVRVVVDPSLRSPLDRHVFLDRAAPTLVLHGKGGVRERTCLANADLVEVPCAPPHLPPALLLACLRERGIRRIFVEGGGVTVSHFLKAGVMDRIHVAVSPMFIGQGRPGVDLPKIDSLDQAMRPKTRTFTLGADVLFDCEFPRASRAASSMRAA